MGAHRLEWICINDIVNVVGARRIVGVYGLKNRLNDKWYVGQSVNVLDRLEDYSQVKCKSQTKIYHALLKYGFANFEAILIEECDDIDWILDYREMYWIKRLDCIQSGYNLREGGNGGRLSEETKVKIRIKRADQIMRPHSEATKEKISLANKGRVKSEQERINLSISHKGQRSAKKGIPLKEEQKQLLSRSNNWRKKTVYIYDLAGNLIDSVLGTRETVRKYNLNRSHFLKAMKNKLPYRDMVFMSR